MNELEKKDNKKRSMIEINDKTYCFLSNSKFDKFLNIFNKK